MKKKALSVSLLVSVLLLGAGLAFAGDKGQDREADHTELRVLLQKAAQAINTENISELEALFSKEFVFTTADQTVLNTAEDIKKYYDLMLHQKDSPVAALQVQPSADILTRFVSENAGYCYGYSNETYTLQNGKQVKMQSRWTATVVKENGAWKAVAVHVGINFLDNPVLTYNSMSGIKKLAVWLGLAEDPFTN